MRQQYDVAVVGGGIAGSALAGALALEGARVVLVEREAAFRDRVRGEWLAPWGVTEARRLGLGPHFDALGAHEVPWNVSRSGKPRRQETPTGDVPLTFSHPALQQALLERAGAAGVEVIRPARVGRVSGGARPTLEVVRDGRSSVLEANVIVGADGRDSAVRRALGRPLLTHRTERLLAGVRVSDLGGPEDASHFLIRSDALGLATTYPQGGGYARVYAFTAGMEASALRGPEGFRRFIAMAVECGIPPEVLEGARAAGPLGAFVAGDEWTRTPYGEGLALVGDAAGTSDPTWGMGIALALRDARTFAEALRHLGATRPAAASYAMQRDRYFEVVRAVENWQSELLLTPGAEASARRARASARWSAEPSRVPDLNGLGPEVDASEAARQRFFGEDDLAAGTPRTSLAVA